MKLEQIPRINEAARNFVERHPNWPDVAVIGLSTIDEHRSDDNSFSNEDRSVEISEAVIQRTLQALQLTLPVLEVLGFDGEECAAVCETYALIRSMPAVIAQPTANLPQVDFLS